MRSLLASLVISLATAAAASAVGRSPDYITYDGYKVVRIKTGIQLAAVEKALSSVSFETWNHDIDRHMDIVLAPDQLETFESLGLDFHTMHENLGNSILEESASKPGKRDVNSTTWFDAYHSYEDHLTYLDALHADFANNSEIVSSGTSYEGRDIKGIHLWGISGPGKPAVLYHGTVHAREWIAAPVVEYIATQLVTGYNGGNAQVTRFLNAYDFYIFPVVNPDGFVHSQNVERLWRKNRQPGPGNSTCIGRDVNRNWDFAWNANGLGASTNPCAEAYQGEAPSDSPENQGLAALVEKLRDGAGIKLYIDWHSYGQHILSPYGYNQTLYAPELGQWTSVASSMSEVMRDSSSARTTFTFGPSGATLYPTTGAAPDYVYKVGKAAFSYTIELRDTGDFGFVLPPAQIRPSAEEQWVGQKLLLGFLDRPFP